jgi:hypothetical protein
MYESSCTASAPSSTVRDAGSCLVQMQMVRTIPPVPEVQPNAHVACHCKPHKQVGCGRAGRPVMQADVLGTPRTPRPVDNQHLDTYASCLALSHTVMGAAFGYVCSSAPFAYRYTTAGVRTTAPCRRLGLYPMGAAYSMSLLKQNRACRAGPAGSCHPITHQPETASKRQWLKAWWTGMLCCSCMRTEASKYLLSMKGALCPGARAACWSQSDAHLVLNSNKLLNRHLQRFDGWEGGQGT